MDYADLFSVTLRDDNIQEFDTKWDEVQLSMSKIPSDDVLESLYKLRIRESAQLKTVLELYDMETHQKISDPKYHMLTTMVKRTIDQKLRIRNFCVKQRKIETGESRKVCREKEASEAEVRLSAFFNNSVEQNRVVKLAMSIPAS